MRGWGDTCEVRCGNADWSTQIEIDRLAAVRKTEARRATFFEKTKWTHEWIALLAKIDSVQKQYLPSLRRQNLSSIINGRVARRLPLNQHRMWLWRPVLHRSGWGGAPAGCVESHRRLSGEKGRRSGQELA